jgi:hypothetical protein
MALGTEESTLKWVSGVVVASDNEGPLSAHPQWREGMLNSNTNSQVSKPLAKACVKPSGVHLCATPTQSKPGGKKTPEAQCRYTDGDQNPNGLSGAVRHHR